MATIHPFHKELLTLLYSYVGKGYKSSFSAQTLSNTIPLPQSILVKPSSLPSKYAQESMWSQLRSLSSCIKLCLH